MDINIVRGIITATLLVCFIALWIWAWSAKRRTDFDDAAQLPFRDEHVKNRGDRE